MNEGEVMRARHAGGEDRGHTHKKCNAIQNKKQNKIQTNIIVCANKIQTSYTTQKMQTHTTHTHTKYNVNTDMHTRTQHSVVTQSKMQIQTHTQPDTQTRKMQTQINSLTKMQTHIYRHTENANTHKY